MSDELLTVKSLKMWFEVKRWFFSKPLYVRAIDDVSLTLKRGESLSVVGESGSGKTTLGKTILRLYEPTDGKIIFDSKDITRLRPDQLLWYRRRAQLVQQDPYGALPPFLSIYKALEEPLLIHKIGDSKQRREMILEALETVGISPAERFAMMYPHTLSGGQRQRIVIARAVLLKPDLIVADEPVSMLDASVRISILKLMDEIKKRFNLGMIYITHDLSTAKYFSDRIMIMYAGKVLESGGMDLILDPMHPYTQALIAAIPDPDPDNVKVFRNVPPGEPPNPIVPPSGCRFHPRCPHVMDVCRKEEPPLIERKGEGFVACWLYYKR